jgi:subtilisin-like proprotein convertase family protein
VVHFTANEGSWSDTLQVRVGVGGAGAHAYPSTDTPRNIPDNSTISSPIAVVNPGTVSDVNVSLNATHTYDGDLQIDLVGPNGTRVALSSRNGGAADNYVNTVFDDQATTPIASGAPPYTGSFKPTGSLAALNGITGTGTWRVEIADQASADTGTLTSWTLTLVTSDPYTCTTCSVPIPGEVPSLGWAPGTTDDLGWSSLPAAGWYDLHRGTTSDLPALLSGAVDSCVRYTGIAPDTGAILTEAPPAGDFYWYLVTAASTAGSGSAGSGSGGPRIVNGTAACP